MKNLACSMVFCGLLWVWPALGQPPETNAQREAARQARNAAAEPLPLVTWDELNAQLGEPTLLSLHATALPALQVVEALNRQSPVTVRAQQAEIWPRLVEKTLTADYLAQPFWQVINDIARKLEVGVQTSGTDVVFVPYTRVKNGRQMSSGPCTFAFLQGTYQRTVGWGQDAARRNETLFLMGKIDCEPKVHWYFNSASIHLEAALDDKNQSLLPDEKIKVGSFGGLSGWSIGLKSLGAGERGQNLKTLRGSLHGAVAALSEAWEVPDVMNARGAFKAFARGVAGARVELKSLTKEGDNYRLVLTTTQPTVYYNVRKVLSTGEEILVNDGFARNLRLMDAQGRDLFQQKLSIANEEDDFTRVLTTTAVFGTNAAGDKSSTGPPDKLLLRYNSAWRELIVPFEFANLPLP